MFIADSLTLKSAVMLKLEVTCYSFSIKADGFNRAIEAPISELANVQFTKFTPRRDVFPLIDRQLLLRKIPLNVHKPVIESYFKKVGDIEKITLSPNEGFQNGTVTFVHPDAMADFRNLLWAVYINGHTILTTPANFSKTNVIIETLT